ncbi:MAG: hypothetical protein LAT51_08620 [Flavobacteriaceae bacterium]|nr:hypothetical protein [Flavobacteriaceae bacterium]
MHKLGFVFLIFVSILGCQSDSSKNRENLSAEEHTLKNKYTNTHPELLKVAQAHGLEAWEKTKKIDFQFNYKQADSEMNRMWSWDLENQMITRYIEGNEITTTTDAKEANPELHQAFINDTYWLVFPFHLLWTDNFEVEVDPNSNCPMSDKELTEISIHFKEIGGYTPGDSYKIYVNEDHMIQSWSFHSGGNNAPDLINAWENYQSFEGIQISMNRPNDTGDFEIYFNEINVHQ